jgi:hypothetical protein
MQVAEEVLVELQLAVLVAVVILIPQAQQTPAVEAEETIQPLAAQVS